VFALSGGEKRKVALAATLALRPQVLLLDEPTAGLDPAAHLEVLGRLASLQAEGMTTVLSSHRMNDLAALASRLAVFERGTVIREGPVGEVFWDFKGLAEAGLEPPLVVRTASRLQERGWPIPKGIVTPDALADALRACDPGGKP
jgi:energy-coupling factor transport system ATP-binding protein